MPQLSLQTDRNQRVPYKTAYDFDLAITRHRHRSATGVHFSTYDADKGLLSPGQYSLRDISLAIQISKVPYLIGVELEVEGVESRSRLIDALSRIKGEYVLVRDGSLDSSGAEIVTLPIDPNKLVSTQWYTTLKSISALGITSYDSGRCGLHLSVGKTYLKTETWSVVQRFLTKHKAHFQHISQRRTYNYCEFKTGPGKYRALNLDKTSVAEFRFFRGNLKPEKFFGAVETIRALVESAKTAETDGKRLTWKRYVKTIEQYKYAKTLFDSAPVLVQTERASTPRPRRTMVEIANTLVREMSRRWRYGGSGYRTATLPVTVDYATNEIVVSFLIRNGAESIFEIPRGEYTTRFSQAAIFPRYFPRYMRKDIDKLYQAGWKFRADIVSDLPLKDGLNLILIHSSGGWGNRASIRPVLSTSTL